MRHLATSAGIVLAACVLSFVVAPITTPPALARIQQAPNSRVVLDLPADYQPSALFSGFQNETNGTSYVILEAPLEAYDQMKAGFTEGNLAKRGITDVRPGKLKRIGDYVYMRAKQSSPAGTYAKFFVIFPTDDQTILVSDNVPQAAVSSGEVKPADIEKVLATATTVSRANITELYFFDYLGPFKEAGRVSGMSKIYTRDGRMTPAEKGGTTRAAVIVGPSIDKRQVGDGAAASKSLLSNLAGYSDLTITKPKPITIGGLKGFEVEASAKDTKTLEPVRLLQTLLIGASGGYYRMIAISPQDQADTLIPEARKMARSFKLKP